MRLAAALLVLAPVLTGCGGWHPLYQDPSAGAPQFDTYTATCDANGQVTPGSGTVQQNTTIQFTVTPNASFEVASYSINGATPVNVEVANPNPAGGVPYQITVPITQSNYVISFTTIQVPSGSG